MIYDIDWPDVVRSSGRPVQRSQRNIKAFLDANKIEVRRDAFSLRNEIIRDGRTGPLDSDLLREIRLEADDIGLSPKPEYFNDVVLNCARHNAFHPVLQYIEGLKWDGVKRIDRFLPTYAGTADTPLYRAQGRKMLIAAVRRVRQPGSKFDNCVVLEGPQGVGKSSFVKELAGEAWFSDSLQIGTDPKATIEQTAGKWICEFAELANMRAKEWQTIKAFLSRSTDRAALKYQPLATDVPRQFICIATVNDRKFLGDQTGNRRFWCITVGAIDPVAVRRDRDQIWAEAAHLEEEGESTELPRELWAAATLEQEKRLRQDPWFERLEPLLGDEVGAVAKDDLWRHLQIDSNRQDPRAAARIEEAMTRLGYHETRLRGHSKFPGKAVRCFVRKGWGNETMPWLLNPEEPARYPAASTRSTASAADLWR